jgi:hypothetical protein
MDGFTACGGIGQGFGVNVGVMVVHRQSVIILWCQARACQRRPGK